MLIDKESVVDAVIISPKFQVVIPKRIREDLGLRPGQKVQAIEYGNRVELVPVKPARELRGFLRGIDLTPPMALEAARTSVALGLPLADSIMLATARSVPAEFFTQDSHFVGIDGAKYVAAPSD